MLKRMMQFGLIGLILGGTTMMAAADELDALEKKIVGAWKTHKSMSADVSNTTKMDMGGMKMEMTGEGEVLMARRGDHYNVRMEMDMDSKQTMGDQVMEAKRSIKMVMTDEKTVTLMSEGPQTMAIISDPSEDNPGNLEKMFEALKKENEVKQIDDAEVNGHDCWVVEATPKQAQPMAPARMVYYFDKKGGATVKTVNYDKEGNETQVTEYTNIKYDVDVKPEHFELEIPDDVQVMDQRTKKNGGSNG